MSINDRETDDVIGRLPAPRSHEHSILTFTGKRVWPLDPRVEDIDIRDIAHALANSCRFTGHVREFYSVAQHSCLVADEVRAEHKLWGLLHDASEAYLSDIARPVKHQEGFAFYRSLEEKLERVIAEKFNLPYPLPEPVKKADSLLLVTEKRDLMPDDGIKAGWPTGVHPLSYKITPWPPKRAERTFLNLFVLLVTGVAAEVGSCDDYGD